MHVLVLDPLKHLSHYCSSLRVDCPTLIVFSLPYFLVGQVFKQICGVFHGEVLLMRCEQQN